ncbi:MAG: polysaccharide deacetylase family protein [Corallococcus sp.]|nr:polysaccharide deacetylase family protein [Corallococcus sp.]
MENETFMRFQGGKPKALTLSYDDGVVADKRLLGIMNKYNLKGTFNLNSAIDQSGLHNRMPQKEAFELFKDCGQEIAVHGAKHLFLTKISVPRGLDEILSDRKTLEQRYGRIINGMAYAYGALNDEIKDYLKMCGIDYARTVVSTGIFDVPSDWLQLNPTCHHTDENLMALADKFIEQSPDSEIKHREPWLFYLWGHSYEFDENDNWEIIEQFAERVCGKHDVWYATNGEIYRYVKAYNDLVFSVDGALVYNPSATDVWVEQRGKVCKVVSGATVNLGK